MIVACSTPPRTARMQASIFGRIPDASEGSISSTSSGVSFAITSWLFGQSA
jgi:hypothetical protein